MDAALNRVLTEDVLAPEDLPPGARSTVDGYAVVAEDTFGASDALPAFLTETQPVSMGAAPDFALVPGQAAPIPTGGFLPSGADAVVMVEYTNHVGNHGIEVTRPVTQRANVLERGEDCQAGHPVLSAGKLLRSQETGLLAALGILGISVHRRPKAAIISSGDEVVAIDRKPTLGQIRDANGHALAAVVREAGSDPICLGIVPDDAARLRSTLEKALADSDVVIFSGGSSVGTRDLMVDVLSDLPGMDIVAHGVAIKPGKPTLLAKYGGKAVWGLPGHPVSALIVAQIFLAPFLRYLQGRRLEKGPSGCRIKAALGTSISSTLGLEEFVRVRLERAPGGALSAWPVFGKSGILSTMVKADGIVVIPMESEGLLKGETVEVIQF